MLKHIKEHALVKVYDYHYEMANYYNRELNRHPENRAKLEDKVLKHAIKEMLVVEKLVKMRLKEA